MKINQKQILFSVLFILFFGGMSQAHAGASAAGETAAANDVVTKLPTFFDNEWVDMAIAVQSAGDATAAEGGTTDSSE